MEDFFIFWVLGEISMFVQHFVQNGKSNLNLDLGVAKPWLTGTNISALYSLLILLFLVVF